MSKLVLTEDETLGGGRKSPAHIRGQNRLCRIYKDFFTCEKEGKLPTPDGQYQGDVVVMRKITGKRDDKVVVVLEVDTYVYGTQKKKSPAYLKKRDKSIMTWYKAPVIRIDVDALKEGRSKTKFYMSDEQIRDFIIKKHREYMKNPAKYADTLQRG